jgi:hypothetical protein
MGDEDEPEDKQVPQADYTQFERDITAALRRYMDWIYRQLESEHDYQRSNEYVDDCIEANDYDFYENGKRFVVDAFVVSD